MTGFRAYDAYHAVALDDLAFAANAFYGSSNFHRTAPDLFAPTQAGHQNLCFQGGVNVPACPVLTPERPDVGLFHQRLVLMRHQV